MRRLAIVLNPNSGSSETSEQEITKLFSIKRFELKFFDITKGLPVLKKSINAYKAEAVIAVGGDGTVNAVATIATQLDLPMGVIASGTLNHFAKDMNLPLDPSQAAKVITQGKLVDIDYATVNDRVFVNNSSLGAYPEVVIKRDKLSILNSKWLSAIVAALQTLRQHRKQPFEVVIDGKSRKVRAGSIFVGNNRYTLKGTDLSSRRKLDASLLQLVVVRTGRLRHLLGIMLSFAVKKSHEKVTITTAQHIQIRSTCQRYNVAIDGEVIDLKMPLDYKIHAKALRVFGKE